MREPLHVCFLNISFGAQSAGGVMHHMAALGKGLAARDVSVSVICPAWGAPWRYLHEGAIDVIGIREAWIDWKLAPAMPAFGRRCGRALLDLHREKPIDLIHLHDRPPFSGAAWAGRRLGAPVVYTAHSLLHGGGAPPYRPIPLLLCRALERRIARSGLPIIAVSRWARDGMVALGADPSRLAVIPNGVDATEFPYRGGEGRNPGEVLFVGRFDHEKGFDVLLRAVSRLTAGRDVTLMAVGSGELEGRYRALARQLGIADRVRFAGQLFGAQLVAAYHRAAVCVLPSRSEPFGLVMLEAMACGTPFVGAAAGGVAEVAEDGETALLVPPEDPTALAAAISRVLGDADLGRELAGQARKMVEQRFSWEGVAEQTRRFYDRLLAGDRPTPRRPELAGVR